jgi:hypothetical protein
MVIHAWSHAASARDGSDQMAAVCIAMECRVMTMLIVSAGLLFFFGIHFRAPRGIS